MSNTALPLLICGATTDDGVVEVTAPYDGAPLGSLMTADGAAVEQALGTATALARDPDRRLKPHERVAILERAAALMAERADELALGAAREGGKPLPDSKVEVARAIDGIKGAVEVLRTQHGDEIPMGLTAASTGRLAVTRKEPIGVVVAISAFNHPVNLIVHQVVPAVATGCPVIVKPAGDTPLSCYAVVELLREAGLPEGWCQALVVKDRDLATGLATDARVGFLSFIGSGSVGWMLRSKLAPGTRCALEHGGAAPVLVAADADLDAAVPLLAKGGFYHAGQVCVSVQRVFAHESIVAELTEKLAAAATAMVVGDPSLPETEVGPLIRHGETDRVEEWVHEAVQQGARLVCGGKRLSPSLFECTVLADPSPESKVSKQEVFGPVVNVTAVRDLDEAIARANDVPFSFQAAVFTRDLDTAMRAYRRLNASAVMVNDHTAFRVDWMPFAGLAESGLGVGGIPHTMADMQVDKMMVVRSGEL